MSIGSGIFLFVVGAILAFAIHVNTNGFVNLNFIGYLLMAAGIVVTLLGVAFTLRRTRSVSRTTASDGSQVVTEHSVTNNNELV